MSVTQADTPDHLEIKIQRNRTSTVHVNWSWEHTDSEGTHHSGYGEIEQYPNAQLQNVLGTVSRSVSNQMKGIR